MLYVAPRIRVWHDRVGRERRRETSFVHVAFDPFGVSIEIEGPAEVSGQVGRRIGHRNSERRRLAGIPQIGLVSFAFRKRQRATQAV